MAVVDRRVGYNHGWSAVNMLIDSGKARKGMDCSQLRQMAFEAAMDVAGDLRSAVPRLDVGSTDFHEAVARGIKRRLEQVCTCRFKG